MLHRSVRLNPPRWTWFCSAMRQPGPGQSTAYGRQEPSRRQRINHSAPILPIVQPHNNRIAGAQPGVEADRHAPLGPQDCPDDLDELRPSAVREGRVHIEPVAVPACGADLRPQARWGSFDT